MTHIPARPMSELSDKQLADSMRGHIESLNTDVRAANARGLMTWIEWTGEEYKITVRKDL